MNRACSSILKLPSSSHLWFCKYSAKTEVCRSLENYTFVDEMGKDQGINIRHKVTEMLEFIQVPNVWDCPSFVLKPIGKSAFLCRCIFISNLFPHLLTSFVLPTQHSCSMATHRHIFLTYYILCMLVDFDFSHDKFLSSWLFNTFICLKIKHMRKNFENTLL